MRIKELNLIFQRNLNRNLILNILLRPVNNTNIPKLKPNLLIHQHPLRTSPLIHNINLRNHTDSPLSIGIPLPRQFKPIGCREILVCWDDAKDDCLGIDAVTFGHLGCDFLDVFLAFYVDSCYAGEIDYCEVGAIAGEYF